MEKGFGDLFSETWKEYKFNFTLFFKIFLLFFLIPTIVVLIIVSFFYYGMATELTFIQFLADYWTLVLVYFIFGIFYLIMTISFLYISIFSQKNKKMSFGEAIQGSLKYFWKYIGLSLFLIMLLIPLFLLLIIPGLIFAVYWAFSPYILMRENIGIWESMKRSKLIIKGRWWRVVGFSLLFGLITILISIPFAIPSGIINFIVGFLALAGSLSNGVIILLVIGAIIKSFGTLIISPLGALFFKNFYLNMRSTHPSSKTQTQNAK